MSNIKSILNLNKHPNNCDDLSLINAKNVLISPDNGTITSEKSLLNNEVDTFLHSRFTRFKVVGCIPCNTEIIFLVIDTTSSIELTENGIETFICRYNEKEHELLIRDIPILTYGGVITGTFTYNSRNQLILAIAETEGIVDVPLKTINIGTWEEMKENNYINNELEMHDSKLAICPAVKIPTINNINSVGGNIEKGDYYIYIRYKINKNDYTQWYYLKHIFIDSLNKVNIIKTYQYSGSIKYSQGCTDHIDTIELNSTQTVQFDLSSNIDTTYDFYQLSYIRVTNDYTGGYRTSDIDININNYTLNKENFNIEFTINELVKYYNYYNIKKIINYQNRLYISNYKEKEDIINFEEIASKFKLSCRVTYDKRSDLKYILTDTNGETQFETSNINNLNGVDVFNLPKGAQVRLGEIGTTTAFIIESKLIGHFEYPGFNGGIDFGDQVWDVNNFKSKLDEYGNYSSGEIDNVINVNGAIYEVIERITIDHWLDGYDPRMASYKIIVKDRISSATEQNMTFIANWNHYPIQSDINLEYSNADNYYNIEDITVNINKDNDRYTITDNDGKIYNDVYVYDVNGNELARLFDASSIRFTYINTSESFNKRNIKETLIPGEIYSFYIHFVDKFGEATKGYKLSNNYTFKYNNKSVVPISIITDGDSIKKNYIALIPVGTKVFNSDGTVNIPTDILYFRRIYSIDKGNKSFNFRGNYTATIDESYLKIFKEKVSNLNLYIDANWEDIPDAFEDLYYCNRNGYYDEYLSFVNKSAFIEYTNSDGDKLFKVPNFSILTFSYTGNNFEDDVIIKAKDLDTIEPDGFEILFPRVVLDIENTLDEFPKGYIGYFISMEKLEKTNIATGILSKNDCMTRGDSDEKNSDNNNKMQFFCSDYNILDNVKLDYSFGCATKQIYFRYQQHSDGYFNSELNSYCFNQPILAEKPISFCFDLGVPTLAAGGDAVKNKLGIGTSLIIDNYEKLYPVQERKPAYFYLTKLYKINKNIYTNTNKTLIPVTPINYSISEKEYIEENGNYGGYQTYDGIISYNGNSVILNTATTKIIDFNFKEYINPNTQIRYAGYFQFPIINDFMKECKSFNNEPTNTGFYLSDITDKENDLRSILIGRYVSPENSIDLFKNNYTVNSPIETFQNYNSNLYYIYEYNSYIRRSNVIQDENLVNAWRQFPVEGYKIITENKGDITNLVGIGTVLLVHTEHSMFMFDRDNTLQTMDKGIQLQMPDIFDVDYKEIVTSELGYAGLQDRKSYIVDQFGYIFYDNDKNRFYRFDSNKLDVIDNNIINWLNQYKIHTVRFANDKINNRLIINFVNDLDANYNTISFNYIINQFVSFHDYKFTEAFNTKNELYFIDNSQSLITSILQFTKEDKYREVFENDNTKINQNELYFIINNTYNVIKYLEYLTYKLYSIKQDDYKNNIVSSNETRLIPYSGHEIEIYNDLINTGKIDILIDKEQSKNIFGEYKKPYWDLGNWNFSYLRDVKNGQNNADLMSRIYGNYFIIHFILGDKNKTNKIEFEDLNYVISKDKRI